MGKGGYGYIAGLLAVACATAVLNLLGNHINSTTVAVVFLMIVLFTASRWGSRPAVITALFGMLCLNLFYLPPVGIFAIDATDNWVALTAFLLTAITAGQLSARAKRRSEEAEAGCQEIERLYKELQSAFELASHAEALRRSERLKSALLDAVTHDIRTPLTSIKASVTTLLNELRGESKVSAPLGQEGRQEMLEIIDEETDRLNRFIEGMVEMARIEAGEMNLRRQWGLLEEIIMAALERAKPLTRNHKVEVSLDEGLPLVRVDAKAVAQVIYTLLDNAAKYSPPGSRIRVTASRAGDEVILVNIEDEGSGVPAELRERVFGKFFRAMRDGDTASPQATGIGMGLAIARGIVEAHAGRIWIEGKDGGGGTRLALTLPAGKGE